MGPSARLAVSLSLLAGATIGLAASEPSVASAATRTHRIVCTSMQSESNRADAPIVMSGCSRPRITGGSGISSIATQPHPITWSTGKETNYNETSATFPSPGRCSGLTEVDVVGAVVTVSGSGTKQFLGETVRFDVCVTTASAIVELVPGTAFTIGASGTP